MMLPAAFVNRDVSDLGVEIPIVQASPTPSASSTPPSID
jgi:hypothetical protein